MERYFVESDGELIGTYETYLQAREAINRMSAFGISGIIVDTEGQIIK